MEKYKEIESEYAFLEIVQNSKNSSLIVTEVEIDGICYYLSPYYSDRAFLVKKELVDNLIYQGKLWMNESVYGRPKGFKRIRITSEGKSLLEEIT